MGSLEDAGGGLYEVYPRSTREATKEASTSTRLFSLSSAAVIAVFDGTAGDLIFFSRLDDYAKPTKIVPSISAADPFVRVHAGRDTLLAVTGSGQCSAIDAEGSAHTANAHISRSLRILPTDGVVFVLPSEHEGVVEVLLVKSDATIEVHGIVRKGRAEHTKRVVKARKFHNSVVQAAYSHSKRTLCVVGGDAACKSLESISVWRFGSEHDLRSLKAKPFAHFGFGQTRFQRYVLGTLESLANSWRTMQAGGGAGKTGQGQWRISLSPLAERIAVSSPSGINLFQVEEGSVIPMDTSGILEASCKEGPHQCRDCLWWTETRLLCNVSDSKLVVLQTKERQVLFEHAFETASGSADMCALNQAKVTMVRFMDKEEEETQWHLHCVAHRTPEEMLHSYLAKSKFEEAKQIAKVFQLESGMIYKRQWLQSQATATNIERMLFKIQDKAWVIEQCLVTTSEDLEAQKYLLSHGLEQISLALASERYAEDEKTELIKSKIRSLRHFDCLETSLALFDQTYFVEVFSAMRNQNLAEVACLYAQTANVDALQVLLHRHPCFLLPSILEILSCFPESVDVSLYRAIFDHIFVARMAPSREDDPCETPEALAGTDLVAALEEGQTNLVSCKVTDNVYAKTALCRGPSLDKVRAWAPARLLEIIGAGYFQSARTFVEVVSSLPQPVVSPEISLAFGSMLGFMEGVGMGLIRWDMEAKHFLEANNLTKMRILMELSTNETVQRDIGNMVFPFLAQVRSSIGNVEDLLLEFVEEEFGLRPVWVVKFLSNLCSSVVEDLEVSRTTFARKAVDLLKVKPNMGEWDVLSKSLSNLLRSLGQEKDTSVVATIKSLCDRVQSARLLEKHGLKLDIAVLEEYSKDGGNKRTLLRKLLSKAAQQSRQTDEMWDHLWDDACIICELIFKTSDFEDVLSEFCRILLQTGQFLIADRFLDGKDGVHLSQSNAEKVVLATGRDLFYGAKSFSSPEVNKAKQCFLIVPESRVIRKELDFVSSLENVHRFGLGLRPCDVKSITEKTDIFDMILKQDPASYANVPALIQFADSLHLSTAEDHLQIKLKLARAGFEAGDANFALDLVGLFIDDNFVPSVDLVVAMIRGLDPAQVENEFLAEMATFALCYCPEKDLDFLLGVLKRCTESRNKALKAGSILREHDFWVNKACSALSSLLEFHNAEALVDYVRDVVIVVDNLVQVDRILSTLLTAFAAKAGFLESTGADSSAFSLTSPREMRALVHNGVGTMSPSLAKSAGTLMEWFRLLERAGEMIEHTAKFKVGAFVVGTPEEKEEALLRAIGDIFNARDMERAVPLIFKVAEECHLVVGRILEGLVCKIFASAMCNEVLSSLISALVGRLTIKAEVLRDLCETFTRKIYGEVSGTDTFNLLYLFEILASCLSLAGEDSLVGELQGHQAEDIKIFKDVLALIVWIEKEVDFKMVIHTREACVQEMRKDVSHANVNGFACLCECLNRTSAWQDHSIAISTSQVYLVQLECDLARGGWDEKELLRVVSVSTKKLDEGDLRCFVAQLTSSHRSHQGGSAAPLSDPARLQMLEYSLDVAKAREEEEMIASFRSIIVNEKALQSMDSVLNLAPEHRALLDGAECTADLYAALGVLAEAGVDLCALIFAASVYGILEGSHEALGERVLDQTNGALGRAEWTSEEGVLPVVNIIQCLEGRERDCLDRIEVANVAEFIDATRTSVWNEVQSWIKDHEYGESASEQPIVLFLSEQFACWKGWSQPHDEGFDHILLVCQSNEILELLWEGGPQTSKEDFTDVKVLRGSFERLVAMADQGHHLRALHHLLICWEENWKPREDLIQLEDSHLILLVKTLEAESEYALKILMGMAKQGHPAIAKREECERVFSSLFDRLASGSEGARALATPVFFKACLLVPHGTVHRLAFEALERLEEGGVDDDVVGLLAGRGLLGDLCESGVLVERCVGALTSIGGSEAIKHRVAPHVVAELCLLQKYGDASDLVCRFLRTCRTLVTRDAATFFLERYLRAANVALGAQEGDKNRFHVSNLEDVTFGVQGDHIGRAIREIKKCW